MATNKPPTLAANVTNTLILVVKKSERVKFVSDIKIDIILNVNKF
jgi:hypothetical protein